MRRAVCPQFAQARGAHATPLDAAHLSAQFAEVVDTRHRHIRTLRTVAAGDLSNADDPPHPTRRMCARRGCGIPVNKATAKYCSVRCCSSDPERHARLRLSAQRSSRRVLPMTRQLSFGLISANNPEAAISRISEGREDVPRGMSRLCS
jgi:hypothetical protein